MYVCVCVCVCKLIYSVVHLKLTQLCNFLFSFLGPYPRHMEGSRLWVELQLQPLAYATATSDLNSVCDLYHRSQQGQILNQWARPRIEPGSSWILAGFVSTEPRWELHNFVIQLYSNKLKKNQCVLIKKTEKKSDVFRHKIPISLVKIYEVVIPFLANTKTTILVKFFFQRSTNPVNFSLLFTFFL